MLFDNVFPKRVIRQSASMVTFEIDTADYPQLLDADTIRAGMGEYMEKYEGLMYWKAFYSPSKGTLMIVCSGNMNPYPTFMRAEQTNG